MNIAYIVDCKRIPTGLLGGRYQNMEPEQLLKPLFDYFIASYPELTAQTDDVIIGNTVGPGGNIARLSLLYAGLPAHIPGVTVDRQCGSGLEAVNQACRLVQSGAGDIYFAGGVESVSRAPWKMMKPKTLYGSEPLSFYTKARFAPSDIGDPTMIEAAENVAQTYNVSREAQDHYAFLSYQRAALNSRLMVEESIPVKVNGEWQTHDEGLRSDIAQVKLARYKPLLPGGTVTIGNACRLNDGAALALVVSEKVVNAFGLHPKLKFIDSAAAGVSPNVAGIGPVASTEKLLGRLQLTINDINYVEFNEAFASQVVASCSKLGIKDNKLNVSGGALAFGHPYAASGAMLVARSCQRHGRILAAIGIGGGQGISTLFESVG
ncbi:thiolase family protein [Macrococcus equipercicus]|uniref:Putative acetyl-CoA C-acetyltransferase VraB n=1 Tax=Macrococcus equipercicus TaxID=69967 RepID=A0A9Q9BLW4_9STAP|nr:thiolase family protein [Macrococcus equipercicus]UTH13953.1 thiolase family protein [Macrococcus equipercicus]